MHLPPDTQYTTETQLMKSFQHFHLSSVSDPGLTDIFTHAGYLRQILSDGVFKFSSSFWIDEEKVKNLTWPSLKAKLPRCSVKKKRRNIAPFRQVASVPLLHLCRTSGQEVMNWVNVQIWIPIWISVCIDGRKLVSFTCLDTIWPFNTNQ